MRLSQYIAKRILLMFLVLFGMSVITFVILRVVPSSPEAMWVGAHAKPEQIQQARIELGLDKPIYVQYFIYLEKVFHGDFGVSLKTKSKIMYEIKDFFPATFELTTLAMAIAILAGIPLGIASAVKKDRLVDHFSRIFSLSGVSIPVFWLGMLLQISFFSGLAILPLQGRIDVDIMYSYPVTTITGMYTIDSLITGNLPAFFSCLSHIILPAVTLSYASLATITRMTRSSMLEVLRENYTKAARSFGLPESIVLNKLCLKNALIPTITVAGLSYAYALGGTFLVESIFAWPGLGNYMATAILNFDYPVVMAVTLLYATMCVVVNLAADLLYAFVDPRVRM